MALVTDATPSPSAHSNNWNIQWPNGGGGANTSPVINRLASLLTQVSSIGGAGKSGGMWKKNTPGDPPFSTAAMIAPSASFNL